MGLNFPESDLAKIHSIEIINSLCIIKKLPPEKNVLGVRVVVGKKEDVTTGLEKLKGVALNEKEKEIEDDGDLDVFKLLARNRDLTRLAAEEQESAQALKAQLAEKEQDVQALTAQLTEKVQEVQALSYQVAEKERSVKALSGQVKEIIGSKAWRTVMLLSRFRIWLIPPGSWRARLIERILFLIPYTFNIRKNWQMRRNLALIRASNLYNEEWYRAFNPEVGWAGWDPARHFLLNGGFEGRDPGPNFSCQLYLDAYPDVAAARMNPLLHYLKFGKKEGRSIKVRNLSEQPKVGVVIVSYNASLAVRVTLASLCEAKNSIPYEVVLVDNGSNQIERDKIQRAFLKHVEDQKLSWRYIQLEENLGFAGGNNIGIKMFLKDDSISHICMLNSDVIVPDFWLDRLVHEECDLISPVTNKAASSQSVPTDYEMDLAACLNKSKETLRPLVFERVNAFAQDWFRAWRDNLVRTDEDVTFFCVLLSKKIVNKVGLLDTRFFPGGYEDYDYCARVRAQGGKVVLARNIFIHHWGSASFGQLPRDYFDENALRNRNYLEEKYKITWKACPQAPLLSYAQDVAYTLAGRADHSVQLRFLSLYAKELTKLLTHYDKEFVALQELVRNSDRDIPQQLTQEMSSIAAEGDIIGDWNHLVSEIGLLVETMSFESSQATTIVQNLSNLADKVYKKATCNIRMSEFLYGSISSKDRGQLPPGRKGLKGIFWIILKGLIFFWRLKGLVIFGGYPYPEREKDGYYQRIRAIDTLFTDRWRIYFDQVDLLGRDNWYDRPAPNTLVLRVSRTKKLKWVARLCALLCVLRCRVIYFHSVISMQGVDFLMRIPGITKIIDIHGVVPEEFRFHYDFVRAELYERYEKLAIRKARLIIVVSNAMRHHLEHKYSSPIQRNYAVLPIIPEINPDQSGKVYVDGKPVVVYAGGLQMWQRVPKMIDAITKTADICLHKFYCPKPEEVRAMLTEDILNNPNVVIDSKSHQDQLKVYRECHYGFALREDIVVNQVACPTKLVEYIAMGIVPILESENIGDFKSLGMRFVPLQDFLDRVLPDEVTREHMAQENAVIYEGLREQYLAGAHILKQTLKINKKQFARHRQMERISMYAASKDDSDRKPVKENRKVSNIEGISEPGQGIPTCDILVQVGNFLSGGLENVILNISEALIAAGFRVDLLVLGEAGVAVERAQRLGLNVHVTRFDAWEYERLLRIISPKVVISNYSVQGAAICLKLNIPLIQVIHNIYMWFTEDQLEEFRNSVIPTTAFIAVSEFVQKYCVDRLGVPSEKCIVIPNGIDIRSVQGLDITTERKRLRSKYRLSDKDFVFLSVAAFTHQKNLLGVARAFHNTLSSCPQAKLVFLGPVYEKGLFAELQAYIREHKLGKRIIYAGEFSQVFGYYAMADAFICGSFFEGGPLVLIEALVSNLPVITTEVGFAGRFRGHKGIALVPPPVDIINFYGSLLQLHTTVEFERDFARQMQITYNERIRPDLDNSLIEMMDSHYCYAKYVRLVQQLILTGQISTGAQVGSWFKQTGDASPD